MLLVKTKTTNVLCQIQKHNKHIRAQGNSSVASEFPRGDSQFESSLLALRFSLPRNLLQLTVRVWIWLPITKEKLSDKALGANDLRCLTCLIKRNSPYTVA